MEGFLLCVIIWFLDEIRDELIKLNKRTTMKYFYCTSCGACWKEETECLFDVCCPDCKGFFHDNEVGRTTKQEYEDVVNNV